MFRKCVNEYAGNGVKNKTVALRTVLFALLTNSLRNETRLQTMLCRPMSSLGIDLR